MQNYDELRECVIAGKKAQVAELVRKHLDEGKTAKDVMDNGLIPGMAIVGKKFQEGEFFIPEMLMAARSLNAGLEVLRPLLEASDVKPVAKVLMGTVKGDIHDIGKNLVAVMLRGGGFEVIDAGVDVPPDKFVELARENGADLIGLSALLTTTMPSMKDTIDAFQSQGYRENVKIMIGGAPITQEYADEIGADGFARNASYAVELAKKIARGGGMTNFSKMAYQSADDLMFGRAKVPVTCGYGLEVGTGMVLPEVNFTLPTMKVEHEQLPAILRQYDDMVSSILQRLVTLGMPGAMIEFEHAPQMTEELEIGTAITAKIRTLMQSFYEKHGLRTALRVTVCDIREKSRPPQMRSGEATEKMFEAFRLSAANGAHLLSIESTGGKEVSDRALMEADVQGLLLALGILAPRDSRFLWQKIVAIANEHKIIPAGDTACAFANTAMILADQRYIPNVLAAVVRAMSAVRTLVGNEVGAVGPTKDCGYEGPVIKAITGCPVSLEGKSAACAHFSHMGNIAMATCDLWSNESVQNVKLLSGHAPEVFTEILTYDCRLMNEALQAGQERALQNLFVSSDAYKSVHALVISPQASFEIAEAILSHQSDFDRTRAAGLQACQIIRDASATGKLPLPDRESAWLDQIEEVLQENADEGKVLEDGSAQFGELFLPKEYGL